MRYILILFLILAARMSFSQKIDHSFLIGSWQCYNAAQHATTNPHPAEYLESYVSFYSDSTFGEEGLYLRYINTTGYYHIDKKSNNILFKEQVERTRDEKTLSEMKEYMHHERPEQQIISLSKDTLILLEPPKDTLYYKRIR